MLGHPPNIALTGLGLAAVLVGGCLPEGAPPWQVDHVIAAALQVDRAAAGPHHVVASRPDRVVAHVMPGDVARVTAFVVGPDGPVNLGDDRPAWFYCQSSRCFVDVIDTPPPDCADQVDVPPPETCSLGRGETMALPLGNLGDFFAMFADPPAFMMVSGTPGGLTTEACLEHLRSFGSEGRSLTSCLLVVETLPLGPFVALTELAVARGIIGAEVLAAIPGSALDPEPNLLPAIPEFTITVEDQVYVQRSGGAIPVAPGDEVVIVTPLDPFDAQPYHDVLLPSSTSLVFLPTQELLTSTWLSTGTVEFSVDGPEQIRWQVPEDADDDVYAYLLLGDRRSVVWAWLHFEVQRP